MKELLEQQGWTCARCGCPGQKGFDCVHSDYRGFVIKTRRNSFRLIKKGLVIDAGHGYQLEAKLKANEIFK